MRQTIETSTVNKLLNFFNQSGFERLKTRDINNFINNRLDGFQNMPWLPYYSKFIVTCF